MLTASKIKVNRMPRPSEKLKEEEEKRPPAKKTKEASGPQRAKRNLDFSSVTRKSPRKRILATPVKGTPKKHGERKDKSELSIFFFFTHFFLPFQQHRKRK